MKLIGLVTMTIDHIGAAFANSGLCDDSLIEIMRIIGRISAPLFLFLVTDSMQNTSNKNKYVLRLYIANILIALSSLPFVATNILINAPSMLSTYLYVVIYILLFEKIYNKNENKRISVKCKLYYITLAIFVTILPIVIDKYIFSTLSVTISSMFGSGTARCARVIFRTLLPNLINVDYSVLFVVIGVIFYFTNKCMSAIFLALFSGISLVGNILFLFAPMPGFLIDFFFDKQFYMALAIIFIMLYNGEKGKTNKLFFYLYYPIHIYIIYGISYFIK